MFSHLRSPLAHAQSTKVIRVLTKGPDSSFGEVHKRSCSGNIHMEDEVKDQEDEVEDG